MNHATSIASSASWMLVILLCGSAIGCREKPAARGSDFSDASSVTIHLGDPKTEYGNGLQHMYHEKDGLTIPAILGDVSCRQLSVQGFEVGYLYFGIDQSFKQRRAKNVDVSVEYFDQGIGTLGLQFDATGYWKTPTAAYTDAGSTISLLDAKTWKTATFRVRNAAFKNSQNSGSDFRLVVQPPELFIRSVTVTRAK